MAESGCELVQAPALEAAREGELQLLVQCLRDAPARHCSFFVSGPPVVIAPPQVCKTSANQQLEKLGSEASAGAVGKHPTTPVLQTTERETDFSPQFRRTGISSSHARPLRISSSANLTRHNLLRRIPA
jgi:hypothetical protein